MKNINRKNNTQKPEIPGKVKKGFRFYAAAVPCPGYGHERYRFCSR